MTLALIAAIDTKNGLGIRGHLLYHIPEDMKFFRDVTMGHVVVMGRKTYDSIGKVLDGRRNIVMTLSSKYENQGIKTAKTICDVLKISKTEKVFIIGGAEIYSLFMNYATELYITHIKTHKEADTFFPYICHDVWDYKHLKYGYDLNKDLEYDFVKYERKALAAQF